MPDINVAMTPKTTRLMTCFIVILGFALRLYDLAGESLWYDELLQLDISQKPLAAILPALPFHAALPLDYLTTHSWIALGRQDYWVRWPAVLLGTLTLPLAYQLGRSMLGRRAGLLFMLLLALSPFHNHYSQEVRPYAWLVLGVVLAGYAFWRLRSTGRWRYLLPLQIGVLCFSLAHFFAIVIFGPWLLFAGLDWLGAKQRQAAGRALSGLLLSGFVALLVLILLGWGQSLVRVTGLFSEAMIASDKFVLNGNEVVGGVNKGPLVNWGFVKYQILTPLGSQGSEGSLQLFNGLAGLGLIYLLLQKRYKLSLLLSLWLILPIIGVVVFLVHRSEFFASRYVISTLPAYLMLVTLGILALPRWLRCAEPGWLAGLALLVVSLFVFTDLAQALNTQYEQHEKENWRLVTDFIGKNAGPNDAVMAINAESTLNWYYPRATAELNSYDDLASIQAKVAEAERSWVIMSIFTNYLGEEGAIIQAWLSEQGAIRLPLDPLISVYYLGHNTNPDQLLAEIKGMALPVNHILYASLARENRRQPEVARRYLQLAIAQAPSEAVRQQYEADLAALLR